MIIKMHFTSYVNQLLWLFESCGEFSYDNLPDIPLILSKKTEIFEFL